MTKFTPLEKAAIILVSMGEDIAADILKQLDQRDVKRLVGQMSELQRVDRSTVEEVLEEFSAQIKGPAAPTLTGEFELARTIVIKAFGEERSEEILEGMEGGWTAIQNLISDIDDGPLSVFVDGERTQVAAAVLSLTPPERRVGVFMNLDSAKRLEIVTSIARLEPLAIEAIEELEARLKELADRVQTVKRMRVGGAKVAAEILNQLDFEASRELLGQVESVDAELAEKIRELMFRFDDLVRIEDRHMQKLLASVERKVLTLALKKANTEVVQHIQHNLSARVREDILDSLQSMPAVRLSEVEKAQNEIVAKARELEERGEIEIRSPHDIYV